MDHQTFAQLLGNYGEFIGAIAVVATLIYLAAQIRQNTSGLRANAYQSWVAANIGINVAMTNAHQSKMIMDGNVDPLKLTSESSGGYLMIHLAMFQMGQATDYLYRSGSLDEELWQAEMSRLATLLHAPGVRQIWEAGARTQLAPSFVALLESTNPGATYVDWDAQRGFYSRNLTQQ